MKPHPRMMVLWSRVLLIPILLLFAGPRFLLADWEDDTDDPVSTVEVDAVLGDRATLPCDIEPATQHDRVYMVLWFRDNAGKPLYSFDVRGRSFSSALEWSDTMIFGPRASYDSGTKPSSLRLDSVQLDDQGVYRCRVDFRHSPTRNFQINLTVIVPPHQLIIYDNSGRDVKPVIGPLNEDDDLVLTCEVRGGKPPPQVSWFVNEKLTEGRLETSGHNVVVNRLELPKIRRDQLNTTFRCQASNTKLIRPKEETVRLELNLRPISARILSKPKVLYSNKEVMLSCEAVGSRPQATITWYRENRKFTGGDVDIVVNETTVHSTLRFIPQPEDDGHTFKCQADNPHIPGSGLDDSFLFNVVYAPLVSLQLGKTLNPDDIKEGDDVYFECDIRANPNEHKITWLHNGQVVTQNMSTGVIVSTRSLVLQGVTRHDGGSYACVASNSRGESASPPIHLRVQFGPVCRSDEVVVVGGSLDERLRVRCQVTADPNVVTFFWQFNNSGETAILKSTQYENLNGTTSLLHYTPLSDRDYGTLTCWGQNAIGRQPEPCIYQLVPAARPTALRNCTLRPANSNQGSNNNGSGAVSSLSSNSISSSSDVYEVECVAGYDGGLPQRFVLEAYESRTMKPRLNLTSSDAPFFRVELSDLLPARTPTLHIVLYAVNAKGRSDPSMLEDIALKDAEKRTESALDASLGGMSVVPLAALLTGLVLTLGIAVLAVAVLAVRRRRLHGSPGGPGRRPGCAHLDDDAVKQQKPLTASSRHNHNSMLEINHGEHRYVVSYTLKSAAECGVDSPSGVCPGGVALTGGCVALGDSGGGDRQPDILTAPRATEASKAEASLQRPEVLYQTTREPHRLSAVIAAPTYMSPGTPVSPVSSTAAISAPNSGIYRCPAAVSSTNRPMAPNLWDESSSAKITSVNNGTMRKDRNIISNSIPGPESCV